MTRLFAIDENTHEVVVSESKKGSTQINFKERISKKENEVLFHVVVALSLLSKCFQLDKALYNSLDKICEKLYNQHKGVK